MGCIPYAAHRRDVVLFFVFPRRISDSLPIGKWLNEWVGEERATDRFAIDISQKRDGEMGG